MIERRGYTLSIRGSDIIVSPEPDAKVLAILEENRAAIYQFLFLKADEAATLQALERGLVLARQYPGLVLDMQREVDAVLAHRGGDPAEFWRAVWNFRRLLQEAEKRIQRRNEEVH